MSEGIGAPEGKHRWLNLMVATAVASPVVVMAVAAIAAFVESLPVLCAAPGSAGPALLFPNAASPGLPSIPTRSSPS